jgi:hypothetical protein
LVRSSEGSLKAIGRLLEEISEERGPSDGGNIVNILRLHHTISRGYRGSSDRSRLAFTQRHRHVGEMRS